MEIFEIAKTEEEREKDYQKLVEFLKSHGIHEDYKISTILKEKEKDFGLNNNFPNLTEEKDRKRNDLLWQRELLINKYNSLREKIEPLLVLERDMWSQLNELNSSICEIEGHRLSEKSIQEFDDDEYGHNESIGFYRTCLICGKRVYKAGLKNNDVVVKGEEGPKRILYQVHLK